MQRSASSTDRHCMRPASWPANRLRGGLKFSEQLSTSDCSGRLRLCCGSPHGQLSSRSLDVFHIRLAPPHSRSAIVGGASSLAAIRRTATGSLSILPILYRARSSIFRRRHSMPGLRDIQPDQNFAMLLHGWPPELRIGALNASNPRCRSVGRATSKTDIRSSDFRPRYSRFRAAR
jgi:hypothetical protein